VIFLTRLSSIKMVDVSSLVLYVKKKKILFKKMDKAYYLGLFITLVVVWIDGIE
jgi:hypothetical protein